jgi:hypothetical protein
MAYLESASIDRQEIQKQEEDLGRRRPFCNTLLHIFIERVILAFIYLNSKVSL